MRDLVAMQPPDYVVDFAVDPERNRAYVIEINPFGPPDGYGTGTPLFDLRNAQVRCSPSVERESVCVCVPLSSHPATHYCIHRIAPFSLERRRLSLEWKRRRRPPVQ